MNLVYSLPSLIGTLLSLAMALVLLRRKPGRSWPWAATISFLTALWCLCQLFWVNAKQLDTLVLVSQIQYLAITLLPVAWLQLSLSETCKRRSFFKLILLLLIVPLITICLAFTFEPGVGNALWQSMGFSTDGQIANITYGSWFWIMALHSYLAIGCGCLLFFLHFAQSPHYKIHQLVTCVFPLLCLALNYSYITRIWLFDLDPTPLGFVLGFSAWGWVMYRRQPFEITPVARNIAVDSLNDCLIITDSKGLIVDFNPAADKLLSQYAQGKQVLGASLSTMIPQLEKLIEQASPAIITINGNQSVEAYVSYTDPGDLANSERVLMLRDLSHQQKTYQMLSAARQALEEANTELDRLAHTDELTKLANRRFLHMRLDEEIARARRLEQTLGLIFIDLDDFKKVNDRFGHGAGDNVLKSVAQELMAHRKGIDIAARYGGEEFILVITNSDRDGIFKTAQRIWLSLQNLEHWIDNSTKIKITASLGVALLDREDRDANDLINRGDNALYHAKKLGRNRVSLASGRKFQTLFKSEITSETSSSQKEW